MRQLRKAVDDAFSYPIAEIFRVRITARVDEGQNGDRIDGDFGIARVQISGESNATEHKRCQHYYHRNGRGQFMLLDFGDYVLGAGSGARVRSTAFRRRSRCAGDSSA